MLAWVIGEDHARWVGIDFNLAEDNARSDDTAKPKIKPQRQRKKHGPHHRIKKCPDRTTSTPSLLQMRLDALREHDRYEQALVAAGEDGNFWAGLEKLVYDKSAGTFCLWEVSRARNVQSSKERFFAYDVEVAERSSYVVVIEPGMEEDMRKVCGIYCRARDKMRDRTCELIVVEIYDDAPSNDMKSCAERNEDILHIPLYSLPTAKDTAMLIGVVMASGQRIIDCTFENIIAADRLWLNFAAGDYSYSRSWLLERALEDAMSM